MRIDENKIILQCGDKLYRYGLGSDYPNVWCSEIHNPEYSFDTYGHKNQIGACFFYGDENTAKRVLKAAIKKQEEKGNIVEKATLTTCAVREDIVLLDLFFRIDRCSRMISVLRDLNLNVANNSFYNYQRNTSYTKIEHDLELLYSGNCAEKIEAAASIDDFFYYKTSLLGQSLTDFQNGAAFKKLLIEHN